MKGRWLQFQNYMKRLSNSRVLYSIGMAGILSESCMKNLTSFNVLATNSKASGRDFTDDIGTVYILRCCLSSWECPEWNGLWYNYTSVIFGQVCWGKTFRKFTSNFFPVQANISDFLDSVNSLCPIHKHRLKRPGRSQVLGGIKCRDFLNTVILWQQGVELSGKADISLVL